MKKRTINTKKLTFKKLEISKLNNLEQVIGGNNSKSEVPTCPITTSGRISCPSENQKPL